jgi:hypothetical protein
MLVTDLHGLQLGDAARVLEGFDGVFGGEFPHQQCKLAIGRHLDRGGIHSLNVFGAASTDTVHFHNKFDALHILISSETFCERMRRAVHFFEVENTSVMGLPHSRQLAFRREVIKPQDGHILSDAAPATCGLSLRVQWAIRTVKNTINKPNEIVVAFIEAALPERMERQPEAAKPLSRRKA